MCVSLNMLCPCCELNGHTNGMIIDGCRRCRGMRGDNLRERQENNYKNKTEDDD